MGDMLGLRPIILMRDGATSIIERVRGDRNLIPRMFEHYKKNRADSDAPVLVAYGANKEYGSELRALLEKDLGRAVPMYPIGASILVNSGPNMIGMICHSAKRARG